MAAQHAAHTLVLANAGTAGAGPEDEPAACWSEVDASAATTLAVAGAPPSACRRGFGFGRFGIFQARAAPASPRVWPAEGRQWPPTFTARANFSQQQQQQQQRSSSFFR